MFKRFFLHGLVSGLLSALAGYVYYRIWFFATLVDFSMVLGPVRIISLNILAGMVAAFINWLLVSRLKQNGEKVFNLIFSLASFSLVIIPISISLPLDVKFPELFPGLAVPMVFFPALAWFTIAPFFRREE